MTALLLLVSTFCLVFFLGLQSLIVNAGHRTFAFLNSFAIGSANLMLFRLAPNATGLEIAAYLLGGPFGIVAAMEFFRWWKKRNERAAEQYIEDRNRFLKKCYQQLGAQQKNCPHGQPWDDCPDCRH